MPKKNDTREVVATNRKAMHDYDLGERFEAGIILLGTEIKSIRAGQMNLRESYVQVRGRELWLVNAHLPPYNPARDNADPRRARKLLLHKKQIAQLISSVQERGYTILAVQVYIVKGRAKVEIATGRGRKQYDKRQVLAKQDSERDVARALRERARE